jgi:hypothetical protein
MVRRLLGLGSFVVTALWIYFWEWIRSQIYERVQHTLAPYFEWLTLDELGRYGPPAVFIGVGLWLFWLTRPQTATANAPAPAKDTIAPKSERSQAAVRSPYLKEANVYAGSLSSSPELFPYAVVCFGRSGRDADVCVDYSYYANGPWTQRRRLLLKNIPSFRRDERVAITVMSRDTAGSGVMWRWGDAQVKYPNRDEGFLGPNRHLRCRIAFIFPDETEEYAYFIVETSTSAESMPTVIGKHMFDFVDQWERE